LALVRHFNRSCYLLTYLPTDIAR